MGGWKLEAFKMGIYMVFPVSLFWVFNQPEFFEDWMMAKRSQLFPPEDPKVKQRIQASIMAMERQKQAAMEAEFKKDA